jgi:hypothetical protein
VAWASGAATAGQVALMSEVDRPGGGAFAYRARAVRVLALGAEPLTESAGGHLTADEVVEPVVEVGAVGRHVVVRALRVFTARKSAV